MDQHFHFGGQEEDTDAFIRNRAERIGATAVGIVAIGLALGVCLLLVAGGIWAIKAVL